MSDMSAQISSAVSGLSRELDIIANNLANISTVGYKRTCNTFSKMLSAQASQQGNETAEAELESAYDFSQGNFIQSGRTLDFALCGKGFFVIETAQGPLYTRNGSFDMNKNGQFVDSQGRTVAGDKGVITIPEGVTVSEINVGSDGTISAKGVPIGKLKIAEFKDESQLTAAGLNCYSAPADVKPVEAENIIVKQGYLEGSNVQMVEELVDMIMVSRLYEANMKFLSVGSENSKSLINVAMG